MARPPMPVGTYGAINVAAVRRTRTGRAVQGLGLLPRLRRRPRKRVARYGDTGAQGPPSPADGCWPSWPKAGTPGGPARGLTGASRFPDAAEAWLADVARRRADTTADHYRSGTRVWSGRCWASCGAEITVGRLEAFMAGLQRRGLSI